MIKALLILTALRGSPALAADAPKPVQVINLSCLEALISIDQQNLAGLFSFISEKDGPAAFADLIVHNKKALKKFVAKLQNDKKTASGITSWDRDALQFALGIYDSPLGSTVEDPGRLRVDMQGLASGPVVTLEQVAAARGKK